FAVKLPADRARFSHVAAGLAERMTQIGHGAIAIIGDAGNENRRTMRTVAFEHEFFKGSTILVFAGAAFDGAFDIIFWHVLGARFVHGETQAKIGFRIAAAVAGGHHDFARETRKDRAAFGVCRALFAFDGGPLGMT